MRAADVVIGAVPAGEGWRLSVRDNGIGIDPAGRQRVFEMFQRLHTRSDYPGTGVGLSICATVVQRYGGGIWVEEAPGGGSEFCFTLGAPALLDPADAVPPLSDRAEARGG